MILLQEFHKDQYSDLFFSILFYVTYFLKTKAVALQIMLMIPLYTFGAILKAEVLENLSCLKFFFLISKQSNESKPNLSPNFEIA